jgi:hypothetical protein
MKAIFVGQIFDLDVLGNRFALKKHFAARKTRSAD